jgi:hypothetical protein
MDYFVDAFGGFNPQSDLDAALKFGLNVLLLDNRSKDLLKLVKGGDKFGGVEGVPGWIIERREDNELIGYENWPENARFRAYVDPSEYALAYPEFYADKQTFMRYVRAIVSVYKGRHPDHSDNIEAILKEAI